MPTDPRDSARRARRRKWFWRANYLLVIPIALKWIPAELAVAYLVAISIQANVEGAEGVEQGAESRFPEDEPE